MTANAPPRTPAWEPPQPSDADGARLPCIDVDGLPFVAVTLARLSAHICERAARGQGGWVVTPNVDILRRWHRDALFRQLVSDATHFTADGSPIVWASRLQGEPLPGRLAGSDLFVDLYPRAARAGLRLALIGGNPGVADAAVAKFAAREGIGSNMVRTYCPPFGFEHDPREARAMETLLADWQPHLVFVGLTSPKQDVLIRSLRPVLPGAWYLGLGVSFSFVAGDVKRAPPWMQRSGLEWLHRLLQEPVRLAKRYLLHGLPFAAGLLWRAALRRYR